MSELTAFYFTREEGGRFFEMKAHSLFLPDGSIWDSSFNGWRPKLEGEVRDYPPVALQHIELESVVCSDPKVMGGTPCVHGTRIPAHDVANRVANGQSMEEILHNYPTLTREVVEKVCEWAESHPEEPAPPGGRPWRDDAEA